MLSKRNTQNFHARHAQARGVHADRIAGGDCDHRDFGGGFPGGMKEKKLKYPRARGALGKKTRIQGLFKRAVGEPGQRGLGGNDFPNWKRGRLPPWGQTSRSGDRTTRLWTGARVS